jgi:hypothetical protein
MSMTEAWDKAVASMPEGAHPGIYWAGGGTFGKWAATFFHDYNECPHCGSAHQCNNNPEDIYIVSYADTPEDALYNLAVRMELKKK